MLVAMKTGTGAVPVVARLGAHKTFVHLPQLCILGGDPAGWTDIVVEI
jgi:hypothetical protein